MGWDGIGVDVITQYGLMFSGGCVCGLCRYTSFALYVIESPSLLLSPPSSLASFFPSYPLTLPPPFPPSLPITASYTSHLFLTTYPPFFPPPLYHSVVV